MKYLSIIIVFVLFVSCSKEPQAIIYNEDNCSYCKMIISDQRYGAEVITTKGKNYKFDSIECMAAFVQSDENTVEIHSLWVIDFNNPGIFVDAEKAFYLHSELLKSPMGLNFSSFSLLETARNVKNVYPGSLIQWTEVKDIVKDQWLEDKSD
jgi:copper chaperone NosL